MNADAFVRETGVSRETLERLKVYVALLERWQPKINLVGPSTLRSVWRRHMFDSAQLHPLLPENCRTLLDMGSGAGFPGLVLAILGVPEVHLVESDTRKCAFLREAVRQVGLDVSIHAVRLEALRLPSPVHAISARALGPLADLLAHAERFLGPATVCVFPKGRNVDVELTATQQSWSMRVERTASRSDPTGQILRLTDVRRRTEA